MSIKVTQQRQQIGSSFAHFPSNSSSQSASDEMTDSMTFTPTTKKLHLDTIFQSSPSKLTDIFLPSDIDRLRKIFPLLTHKVIIHQPLTLFLSSNLKKFWLTLTSALARQLKRSSMTRIRTKDREHCKAKE
jgi:hypothetical protein